MVKSHRKIKWDKTATNSIEEAINYSRQDSEKHRKS